MQLEGILAIQAGENPRIVRDKLTAFMAPGDVKSEDAGKEGSNAPAAAKAGKAQA
jgi:chemotaxis protein MotA